MSLSISLPGYPGQKKPRPLSGCGAAVRCFVASAGLHPARRKDEEINQDRNEDAKTHGCIAPRRGIAVKL